MERHIAKNHDSLNGGSLLSSIVPRDAYRGCHRDGSRDASWDDPGECAACRATPDRTVDLAAGPGIATEPPAKMTRRLVRCWQRQTPVGRRKTQEYHSSTSAWKLPPLYIGVIDAHASHRKHLLQHEK